MLEVIPVRGKRMLKQFIRLPWRIYQGDPQWVPPLFLERWEHLSERNPYFSHAVCRLWIACRGRCPVGRISAQVDSLHLERYRDGTGFFGMLEALDEEDVFLALLQTAETWLGGQGMRRMLGPFNLSINQECGLLIHGFDTPPFVMMGHGRPYYGGRIEAAGLVKEKDLLAYYLDSNFKLSEPVQRIMAKAEDRVRLRPLRRSRFDEDLGIIRHIFEDAWSGNWGFVPFTAAEFDYLGKSLKLLLIDELVQIAEVDGVPGAMIVVLPNLNELIRDLNGRLFPLGWVKLLWRLKVRRPESARVALMGVRRCYQGSLLGAALAFKIIEAATRAGVRLGIKGGELSWILEDNMAMRRIIESLGGVAYKRYRIYGKEIV